MPELSFFGELQKRKVFQVAAIYGAVAWGVTEVVVTIVSQLFLPQWVATLAVIGFVVGFPIAMFLAWTFDITPDGIRRTTITSRRGRASIAGATVLLVAATAGLFLLIRPALQERQQAVEQVAVLPNSVAVLAFDNASNNADDDYMSAGFGDELREQLGRMQGLRIAARSSSIAAREQASDAVSVAAALGVAHLVEGSFRRRGNGLRISVQLIEGKTGLSVWTHTFDRSPRELLTVQQSIAEAIVQQILPDTAAVLAAPATRVATANELLLLARFYEQKVRDAPEVDEATLLEAIRLYREATEADPDSALAHSRLAGALLYLGDIDGAEAPIFKALNLDPNLSEVQTTVGLYYMSRGQPGALAALERAVALNPNNADALGAYAYLYWQQGRDDGPEDLFRRALALDPLSLSRYAALGDYLGKNAKIDELMQVVRSVQSLFDGPQAYRLIGDLIEFTGKIDETIAWTINARDLEPDNPDHVERLAELFALIGDASTATALKPEPGIGLLFRLQRYADVIDAGEFLMIEEPDDALVRYTLAFALNATGQYESAIRILRLSGLPDSVLTENTRAIDLEAYVMLANAVYGAGEFELAEELANWWLRRDHTNPPDWWSPALDACMLAIVGRDEEALARFEDITKSARIPWVSVTQDSVCFRRFADNPRYNAVLEHSDARRAAIRARLPQTLERFGVTL